MTGRIELEIAGPVATIVIDNPSKRNSFSFPMAEALHDAARAIAANREIRAAVIRGRGNSAFSAGMDFDALTGGGEIADRVAEADRKMSRAAAALRAMEVPLIAALRGACIGAGVQVALAADFRLAADDLSFGIPAVGLGIVYPLDALAEIVRLAGPASAKLLLIEGAPIDAARALAAGFIDRVVPAQEFEEALAGMAERIAGHPSVTVRAYKRIIDNLASGAPLGASEDIRDGVNRSPDLVARLEEVKRRRSAKRGR